ncbi:hypothetical protein RHGRI_026939 [Rhododendron griersonianum]|uniref:Uncharacterized protein n=1 Tax=Rhododendron griersonianum TaxID=479676 RepID=A0AAV6IUF5_9ERIC|nr:hypothetical protein RHGRI_026939 [Rhododendron griersonianum]
MMMKVSAAMLATMEGGNSAMVVAALWKDTRCFERIYDDEGVGGDVSDDGRRELDHGGSGHGGRRRVA